MSYRFEARSASYKYEHDNHWTPLDLGEPFLDVVEECFALPGIIMWWTGPFVTIVASHKYGSARAIAWMKTKFTSSSPAPTAIGDVERLVFGNTNSKDGPIVLVHFVGSQHRYNLYLQVQSPDVAMDVVTATLVHIS